MLAAGLAQFLEIVGYLAIAIDATAFQPGLLDESGQALIFLGTSGDRIGSLGVVAARMDLHHAAHRPHGMLFFMGTDEGVPYRDSLAKYAAAFFRMSRSSVTRRNSAFSRRISSC